MPQATPTVGRIVHYKTRGSADGVYPPTNFAAIITEVCDGKASLDAGENCVHLAVFGPQGLRFELHVVQGDNAAQWNWPERAQPLDSSNGGQLTRRPPMPTSPMGGLTAEMPAETVV